jgi:hypothetical protein
MMPSSGATRCAAAAAVGTTADLPPESRAVTKKEPVCACVTRGPQAPASRNAVLRPDGIAALLPIHLRHGRRCRRRLRVCADRCPQAGAHCHFDDCHRQQPAFLLRGACGAIQQRALVARGGVPPRRVRGPPLHPPRQLCALPPRAVCGGGGARRVPRHRRGCGGPRRGGGALLGAAGGAPARRVLLWHWGKRAPRVQRACSAPLPALATPPPSAPARVGP